MAINLFLLSPKVENLKLLGNVSQHKFIFGSSLDYSSITLLIYLGSHRHDKLDPKLVWFLWAIAILGNQCMDPQASSACTSLHVIFMKIFSFSD